MNEDNCRIRRGNDAELFSGIRHIVVCSEYSSTRKDVQGGTTTQDEKSGNIQSLLGAGFRKLALASRNRVGRPWPLVI
ncbi:Uncharacterised protein [Salmonella enterica subsp. enterica]|uniref:Uncharacterized protein n=1 Tax=Salmonella enterica I TaxID=59201 RepID=A0A3S4F748_SALET|nr:Uncharacterised protein [Salmonella enterica subsp. enterica]